MSTQYFHYDRPFPLECGETLPAITIAYHTYGNPNTDGSNTVWVCHALTANSNASEWWPGVIGEHGIINPADYFIICANILGSCYGTTGPASINPANGQPWYDDFPLITIRDMVRAHILLRQHLGIERIHLLMGGSMGGYQALEWCVMESARIENLFLLATSPAESAWGIAIHAAQRLAIEADISWKEHKPKAGHKGMKAARAIGMLTYRNYGIMVAKQSDSDPDKLDHYRAASYIEYQGEKLANRFHAYTYWLLTKAMDTHHLARDRGGDLVSVLKGISQRTLIVGITSDILCPMHEQIFLDQHIPGSVMVEIDSAYGHDGFMVEADKIGAVLKTWLPIKRSRS
ncbi:homoserine O-acetyltransferase family protein [Flavitalea antarctica]